MTTQQDERAEFPPLPEPDGYAAMTPNGSIIVPPSQYKQHNAYAVFTANQMREYARAAILQADAKGGEAVAKISSELREIAETMRRNSTPLLTVFDADVVDNAATILAYAKERPNAELDMDSNAAKPEQQRELAGSVALGQSVGGSKDKAAGHSQAQGIKHHVATVVGVDEYGPMLEWTTHWVELVGAKLYTRPQPAAQVAQPLTIPELAALHAKTFGASEHVAMPYQDTFNAIARAVEAAHGIGKDQG